MQFYHEIDKSLNASVYVNYDKETSVTLLEWISDDRGSIVI